MSVKALAKGLTVSQSWGFGDIPFPPILTIGSQPYHSNSHWSETMPAQLSYWKTWTVIQTSENTLICCQSNSVPKASLTSGLWYVIIYSFPISLI